MEWFTGKCLQTGKQLEGLYERGLTVGENELWKDSVLLQVKIHRNCLQGAILFTEAFATYERKEYKKAFFLLGNAAEAFEAADSAMRDREHGKWKDFYANDCLTDVKETAYCLKRLMGYMRNLGDGPVFTSGREK